MLLAQPLRRYRLGWNLPIAPRMLEHRIEAWPSSEVLRFVLQANLSVNRFLTL